MGLKMCKVTVGSRQKAYPDGTPYGEIVKDFDQDCKYAVVLVTVDGKLRELHKKIHRDCQISLVTVADSIGHKTYKRSMNLLLLKAVYHVAGHEHIRKIVLHFSVGEGFYYTIDGDVTIDRAFLDRVEAYMQELVKKHQGENFVIAAHGGVNRTILCYALGLSLRYMWNIRQDNTAINVISFYEDGKCTVDLMNSTEHLKTK